jgi:hypothetical protein
VHTLHKFPFYFAVNVDIASITPLNSPRITPDIVITRWIFYDSNELDCMVDYFSAYIKNTWFIEDEIDICGDDHRNWSFLEDAFKLGAAPVNDITASNWKMWHLSRVILARFCCLVVGVKVFESDSLLYYVLICISHHSSSAADVTVRIAAVD